LNACSRRNNVFFKIVTGKNCNVSSAQRIVHMIAGTALSGIGLIPMLVAREKGAGGTLMLAAERFENEGHN